VNPKRVNLVLPGFFRAFQLTELDHNVEVKSQLQWLISKSDYIKDSLSPSPFIPDEYLSDLSLAAYEQPHSAAGTMSFYADPINLEIKSDHLAAYPVTISGSDIEKIERIVKEFNQYFSEDGIILSYENKGKFIIRCDRDDSVVTEPVYSIYDRDIKHFLPKGSDATFWIRVFNDIQMFFHHYIDIEQRSFSNGVLNGFWLWGNGVHKDSNESEILNKSAVISDCSWVGGYCESHKLNKTNLESICDTDETEFTIIDEGLLISSSCGDFSDWSIALSKIEEEVIEPLINLLKNNVISSINVIDSKDSYYCYKNRHRFRFYKTIRPLKELCVK